jgi:nitrite reductase (NO-forming)
MEALLHAKNERAAKEFHMIFSEIFNSTDKGFFRGTEGKVGSFDFNKFIANKLDLILTNGMAYKYIPFFGSQAKIQLNMDAQIFNVKPGELTRWYVINAGPRGDVAFNFAGGWLMMVPVVILVPISMKITSLINFQRIMKFPYHLDLEML